MFSLRQSVRGACLELNTIYCEDCLETMGRMPDEFVDLVITSPPYDNIRTYGGYKFDFEATADALLRVVKKNGVLVWVHGDAVINGSESGTSFFQALSFMAKGFKLHDTMIYEKNSSTFPAKRNGNRYTQIFEYMFVFTKGKPKAQLICDKKNKWAGITSFDGTVGPAPEFSPRTNIWKYTTSFNDKTSHPAVFPEKLAADHILSWSSEGDLVYDPFMGSGTTAKAAILTGRNYIGSEISPDYHKEAVERVEKVKK